MESVSNASGLMISGVPDQSDKCRCVSARSGSRSGSAILPRNLATRNASKVINQQKQREFKLPTKSQILLRPWFKMF
jgi:hypothetical protein